MNGKVLFEDSFTTPLDASWKIVALYAAEPANLPPPPARTDLPEIDVHFTIYDGIPLIEKWVTIRNTSDKPVRVNKLISETLRVPETEGIADQNLNPELSSLYVESDCAFRAMNAKSANKQAVKWLTDPGYTTQVSYENQEPCRVEVAPEFGPDTDVAPRDSMTSVRAFELFRDGMDRERRGLEQRRMYRVIAPWSQENPVMLDDSHAVGYLGKTGRGTPEHCGVSDRIDILTGTLGKALGGASGGYVSGRQEVIDLLRQRSRPYLFSNSVTPAVVGASPEALQIVTESDDLRTKLFDNTRLFRKLITQRKFDLLPGEHPIIPVMLGDAARASAMAEGMLARGAMS